MKTKPSLLNLTCALGWAFIGLTCGNPLQAQTPVVDVSTTSPAAMPRKMTGYNNEDFRTAYDLVTTDYATHIGQLNLGFWRWYAGTVEGVRNWQRGNYDDEKLVQYIASNFFLPYNDYQKRDTAKGNGHIKEAYDIASSLGLKFVVTVNAFTGTPTEIGALAKYCLDHAIKVDAWELGNEPQFFQGTGDATFWKNAGDYLDRVKPFNDAIKAQLPNARTFVCYGTNGTSGRAWTQAIKAYQDAHGHFWDGVTYHSYDGNNNDATFDDKKSSALNALNTYSAEMQFYIDNSWATAPFMTTELNTAVPSASGFWFTLFDGIYLAETSLRMTQVNNYEKIGRTRVTPGAIAPTNDYSKRMDDEAEKGNSWDTNAYPHNLYFSAAGYAVSLVDQAINHADTRLATTVTGSPTIPLNTDGTGSMPALFAQGYRGKNGQFYLCITNKGATAQNVKITKNSVLVGNVITVTSVSNPDPSANNSPTAPTLVTPVATTYPAGTPTVSIPGYSVARLDWTVAVTTPVLDAPLVYDRIVGANALTLKWEPVDEAAGYIVSYWPTGVSPTLVDVGNVMTQTLTGLTAGTSYNYQITPYYINSSSVKVNGPSPSPTEAVLISKPASPTVTVRSLTFGQIEATWTSQIRAVSYEVTWTPAGGSPTVVNVNELTSFILPNCTPGTNYAFTVKAINGMGASAASTSVNTTYPSGVQLRDQPYAGANLQTTSVSSTQVALSWELPMAFYKGWYFENGTDASDWTLDSPGDFSVVAHPDNSVLVDGVNERNTHVFQSGNSTTVCRAVTSDVKANLLLQALVEVPNWGTSSKVWVYARYQASNLWYRFGYDNAVHQYVLQKSTAAGGVVQLAAIDGVLLDSDPSNDGNPSSYAAPASMKIAIRVVDNRILGFMNGSIALTATDSSSSTGSFAISTDQTSAMFDRIETYNTQMTTTGTFQVWRSPTGPYANDYVLRTTTAAGATSYTDAVTSGTTYYYKLYGLKAGLTSRDSSNIRTVVVP